MRSILRKRCALEFVAYDRPFSRFGLFDDQFAHRAAWMRQGKADEQAVRRSVGAIDQSHSDDAEFGFGIEDLGEFLRRNAAG